MSPGSVVQSSPEPRFTLMTRVGGDGERFFSVRRRGVTGSGKGGNPSPPLIRWGRAGGGGPQLFPEDDAGHIKKGAALPMRFKKRRREMRLLIVSPFPLRPCASGFPAQRLFNAETRSAWSVSGRFLYRLQELINNVIHRHAIGVGVEIRKGPVPENGLSDPPDILA